MELFTGLKTSALSQGCCVAVAVAVLPSVTVIDSTEFSVTVVVVTWESTTVRRVWSVWVMVAVLVVVVSGAVRTGPFS